MQATYTINLNGKPMLKNAKKENADGAFLTAIEMCEANNGEMLKARIDGDWYHIAQND